MKPVDAELALKFCHQLLIGALLVPVLPWRMEGDNIMGADSIRVAEVIRLKDGRFICGMAAASTTIAQSYLGLARLLALANSGDVPARAELADIQHCFVGMLQAGQLPVVVFNR
jgi:hypothetical protein